MVTHPLTRRRRAALTAGSMALLVLVLALAFAGYTNYRIDRFGRSVFRDGSIPPQTEYGAATPTTVALATASPATSGLADPNPLPTTPTATASIATATAAAMATATVAPPATAIPTPTPLPYGNSPVIRRLRAGERISVLLVGIGGPGHDGGYLTDSIQVMSFEPRGGVATLISVPRDLWVYLPPFDGRGGHWGKINEAYSVGMGQVDRNDWNVPTSKHDKGGQLASKVVAEVLGLPIDYWVSLDFVGFRQFIDALGGVDVVVERSFTDTQYPANDDAEIDPSYKTIRFDAGLQHLNGERAIQFARSRYAPEDGSDFGRARRQQLLMAAVKDQTFRVETIPKVFGLLGSLEGHLRTSFSFAEAKDLAGWAQEQARDKRQIGIRTGIIDADSLLLVSTSPGGAYILLPRTGQGDYSAIRRYLRDRLDGSGPATPGTPGTPARPATPGTPGPPSR